MLVHKIMLKALGKVTDRDDSRYYTKGIYLRPDGTLEATDGHILLRAAGDSLVLAQDAPERLQPLATAPGGFVIPEDVLKGLEKAPKPGRRHGSLEILDYAAIGKDERGMVVALSTDLASTFEAQANGSGLEWPNTDRVLGSADRDTPVHRVSFAANILERLADTVKALGQKHGAPGITFTFPVDPKRAVKIALDTPDRRPLTGLAMPTSIAEPLTEDECKHAAIALLVRAGVDGRYLETLRGILWPEPAPIPEPEAVAELVRESL